MPRAPSARVEESLHHEAAVVNGFRALALLLLVLGHYATTWPEGTLQGDWEAPVGYSIVVLFVVSGFTMTWAMVREFEQDGTIALDSLFARKAVRLFPTLLAFTVVTTVHHSLNGIEGLASRVAALVGLMVNYYNALALDDATRHNVGHLWSIAVGAHFILFWPALLRWGVRRNREGHLALFLAAVIGASLALRVVIYPRFTELSPAYLYNATETRVGEIAIGALAALLFRIPGPRRLIDRVLSVRWLPAATLVALILSLAGSEAYTSGPGHTVNASLTVLLLLQALCHPELLLPRLLSIRPLMMISAVSYSLFVWHWYGLALHPFPPGVVPAAMDLVMSLAITILSAGAAYLVLERPFRQLAQSWR